MLRANVEKFNNGQREVFDRVFGKVLPNVSTASILGEPHSGEAGNKEEASFNGHGMHFVLDAPGGTGKTFVLRAIQHCLDVNGKKVLWVTTAAVEA